MTDIPSDNARCVDALGNPMAFRRIVARGDGDPRTLASRKAWARGKNAGNLLGALHVIRVLLDDDRPGVQQALSRFQRTIRDEHGVTDPWPNDAKHDEDFARRHAR